MKKILITTKTLAIGGVETSLVFLINKLINDYEIDLLVMDKGELEAKIDKRVNIILYNSLFPNINLKTKLYNINKNIAVIKLLKMYKNMLNKEYDVSIAYYGFDNYTDLVAASVKSKKKIIWVHNDFKSAIETKKFKILYKFMYKLMGRKFNYFDFYVCVSKYAKQNFDDFFNIDSDKSICIHNYISENYVIDLSKQSTSVKLNKENFNIIAIGRLVKSKNFDKIITVVAELKKKSLPIYLYILGDGPEFNNLNALVSNYNASDYISMLGNQINPYNILKQADLLLSMSEFESFGNILIEGLLLNIPYISNINSGSKEIFENCTPKGMGIICKNSEVKDKLIEFYNNKDFKYNKFQIKKYNNEIIDKIYEIIKG